jgi:hypothetical protein
MNLVELAAWHDPNAVKLQDMLVECYQCQALCTPESMKFPAIALCMVCEQRGRRLNHRDPWMGDVLADRWRVMFVILSRFKGATWEWPSTPPTTG